MAYHVLFINAYRADPNEILKDLYFVIDKENTRLKWLNITDRIDICWDGKIQNVLLEKLYDPQMAPDSIECLLKALLKHKVDNAIAFAKSFFCLPLPESGNERLVAIKAASSVQDKILRAGRGGGKTAIE